MLVAWWAVAVRALDDGAHGIANLGVMLAPNIPRRRIAAGGGLEDLRAVSDVENRRRASPADQGLWQSRPRQALH